MFSVYMVYKFPDIKILREPKPTEDKVNNLPRKILL